MVGVMKPITTIARLAAPIARDLVGVAGGACVAGGVGMIHVASGVIVAGTQLIAVAWLLARRG